MSRSLQHFPSLLETITNKEELPMSQSSPDLKRKVCEDNTKSTYFGDQSVTFQSYSLFIKRNEQGGSDLSCNAGALRHDKNRIEDLCMSQENATGLIEARSANKHGVPSALQRHPLIAYFLVAYAISWGIGFSCIILLHATVSLWLAILVACGPTISSLIITAAIEGRAGVGRLLRRYVRWRVGIIWYLIAIIPPPVLVILISLTQQGGEAAVLSKLQIYPVLFILTFFVGGPFLEEPGWRGFALPRMQERLGPLPGSLLLGVLWGLWHLPLFFIPGYNGSGVGFVGISTALLGFTLVTSIITPVFAWVSNNTQGSLLIVMLLHASINSAASLIPTSQPSLNSLVPVYAAFVVISFIIIVATSGRLSYSHYVHQTNTFKMDLESSKLGA
jgi:uncharacterized protein